MANSRDSDDSDDKGIPTHILSVPTPTDARFITCSKCGIAFGAPTTFFAAKEDSGKNFWCPNGHEHAYQRVRPKKPPAVEMHQEIAEDRERLRLEVLSLKSQLEQAQARNDDPEPRVVSVPLPPTERLDSAMRCPHCDKPYKSRRCMAKHLVKAHADTATASALAGTGGIE